MNWFLDDGPLGHLAQTFDVKWSWPASTIFVVDAVAEGAASDRSGRRQRLLEMRTGGAPCVGVVQIDPDSDVAEMVYSHLRPQSASSTQDLGEHVTIAHLAIQATDGVFVTCDKGAAYLALSELGRGRVASPFDLWQWMGQQQLISPEQQQALHSATLKSGSLPGMPRRLLA